MTSTLLMLFLLADPLIGNGGVATAKTTPEGAVELTVAHGHDSKAVADAIHDKMPDVQLNVEGSTVTVKGGPADALLEKLKGVVVNEPGPDNMLAMEGPEAGGSIRVARAMDVPRASMLRAKVVALGKGSVPTLKLKRVIVKGADKETKLKPVFTAAFAVKAADAHAPPLKVGDEVLVHVSFTKDASGTEQLVIDQISRP